MGLQCLLASKCQQMPVADFGPALYRVKLLLPSRSRLRQIAAVPVSRA